MPKNISVSVTSQVVMECIVCHESLVCSINPLVSIVGEIHLLVEPCQRCQRVGRRAAFDLGKQEGQARERGVGLKCYESKKKLST